MDQNQGNGLVLRASALGTTSAHIHEDMAAMLFPKSEVVLSDRMVSFSRQYLRALVGEIETEICLIAVEKLGVTHGSIVEIGNNKNALSYPLLQKASLLSSKPILDQVFAQVQLAELTARLLQKISQDKLEQCLTRHLDHDDAAIADAAMGLLVAQSRSGSDQASGRIADLSAENLFALVWPVVAAVQKTSGFNGPHLARAAEEMLAAHDESEAVQNRAQRLVHLLEQSGANTDYPHPLKDGLHLFIARLADRSGLSASQILTFTAEPNMARLAVVMSALNIPVEDAISIHTALDVGGNALTPASYNEIAREESVVLLEKWAMSSSYQAAELALDKGLSAS